MFESRVEMSGEWGGASAVAGAASNENEGDRLDVLHRRLKRIMKARGSLDLQEAAALREAQQVGLWRKFGYASLVEYMELELGYAPRTALERLRVANALPQLPQIAAAMEAGELPFSGVKELTRVATPETESVWIGATKDMNIREVEAAVSGHQVGDLPTDAPDPRLQTRFLRYEVTEEVFALMRQVKLVLEKERDCRLDDSQFLEALARSILDGARPAAQRGECEGGAACGRDHEHDDDDENAHDDEHAVRAPERNIAPYQVAVTVCRDCKRGWQDGAGVVVEMSPAAVDRALCDVQDIGTLEGTLARALQAVPPSLRRAVKRRDHGMCRVPGCRSVRNIDAHHIEPQACGGQHTLENLISLCEGHHLAVHDGTLTIELVDGEVRFSREGRNNFTRATRAVEAGAILRARGIDRAMVREAIERTRAHVGVRDLTVEQWIAIAERYLAG